MSGQVDIDPEAAILDIDPVFPINDLLLVRTVNTHRNVPDYQIRLRGIVQKFHKDWPYQIGLIGLQEVAGEMANCLSTSYPTHGPHCFAEELKALFQKNVSGLYSMSNQVGLIVDDSWEILSSDYWELGLGVRRYLMEVLLRHKREGYRLRFYSTHLSNNAPVKWYERWLYKSEKDKGEKKRARQAKILVKKVKNRAKPGELPPIVVGDFNDGHDFRTEDVPESVRTLEEFFWRPIDTLREGPEPLLWTGVDILYIGRESRFPNSHGEFEPTQRHQVLFKQKSLDQAGEKTSVDGFPDFTDELTDHDSEGFTFLIHQTLERNVKLITLDFVPLAGGTFDLNWPGPPRRKLNYSDVKHYKPVLELDYPTAQRLTLSFWVKEQRKWWFDPTLGFFTAVFEPGAKTPNEVRTANVGGGGRTPNGAPNTTIGSFWLGATKKGKIRGNDGRGDNRHAEVYLEAFENFSIDGQKRSSTHTVNAV